MKIDSPEFKEWFNRLYQGTTSYGRQELFAFNDKLSLIRINHKGYNGRIRCAGFTTWSVAINGDYLDNYKHPKVEWSKDGRLTKEDKLMIKEKYNLHPVVKMVL